MTAPRHAVWATVDREACIGAQTCCAVAPGGFVIDDEGLAVPTDADVDVALLVKAAEECPTAAITVHGLEPGPASDPSEEPT